MNHTKSCIQCEPKPPLNCLSLRSWWNSEQVLRGGTHDIHRNESSICLFARICRVSSLIFIVVGDLNTRTNRKKDEHHLILN